MTAKSTARTIGRAPRMRVPQVELPKPDNSIDVVVNALAEAWNKQGRDPDARMFFGSPLSYQRQDIIARSIYRFTSEKDQRFMAHQLVELARAIEGAMFRWTM